MAQKPANMRKTLNVELMAKKVLVEDVDKDKLAGLPNANDKHKAKHISSLIRKCTGQGTPKTNHELHRPSNRGLYDIGIDDDKQLSQHMEQGNVTLKQSIKTSSNV